MDPVSHEDYRPVERPTYQQELDAVVAQVAQRTRAPVEREAVGRAVRTAHGKTDGLLKGHRHDR